MKTKENGENIYKMLNVWLRNCRCILAFMKKEINDTNRERPERKYLESIWATLNGIFMNNKGPCHILKGRTFFFITVTKTFIKQITWNTILYHLHAPPAINYGKLFVLFFLIFPAPTPLLFFFWFAIDDSLRNKNNTVTAPFHLLISLMST